MHSKPNNERLRPVVVVLRDKINSMSVEQREVFAKKCGTSIDNLRQIAYGWGGCSLTKANLIVEACDNEIQLTDLVPALKQTSYVNTTTN